VIETGLGGRLDATNIIVPVVSVITNIGLEHTALLGDTLQKIAAEKAGIIKKSIPVVIGEGDVRYNEVFEQVAAANKSKVIYAEKVFSCQECGCREGRQHFCMHRVRDDRKFEVDLDLTGNYQRHNILTAAATVDFLHEETPLTISRRAFLEGTRDAAAITSLAGRWQKLGENPLVVCDTGHNPHGIAYVAEQLKATPHKELYCVIGFVRDKDLAHILPLLPRDAQLHLHAGSDRKGIARRRTDSQGCDLRAQGGNHPRSAGCRGTRPGTCRCGRYGLHRRQHLCRRRSALIHTIFRSRIKSVRVSRTDFLLSSRTKL